MGQLDTHMSSIIIFTSFCVRVGGAYCYSSTRGYWAARRQQKVRETRSDSVLLIIVPLLMSALPEEMQKELQAWTKVSTVGTGLL